MGNGFRFEFAITIFVVGDEAPAWVQRFTGADADAAHDSLAILRRIWRARTR